MTLISIFVFLHIINHIASLILSLPLAHTHTQIMWSQNLGSSSSKTLLRRANTASSSSIDSPLVIWSLPHRHGIVLNGLMLLNGSKISIDFSLIYIHTFLHIYIMQTFFVLLRSWLFFVWFIISSCFYDNWY